MEVMSSVAKRDWLVEQLKNFTIVAICGDWKSIEKKHRSQHHHQDFIMGAKIAQKIHVSGRGGGGSIEDNGVDDVGDEEVEGRTGSSSPHKEDRHHHHHSRSRRSFAKAWRKPSSSFKKKHHAEDDPQQLQRQLQQQQKQQQKQLQQHNQVKDAEHRRDEEDEEDSKDKTGDLGMLQRLALNALNLTAPASAVLLNNRRSSWFQLAGHPGSLAPAGPCTLWKKLGTDRREADVYRALMADSARSLIPAFFREVSYGEENFIEIADLLFDFHNPSVMDIKIGTRTFLESEATNKKLRPDMYQKLLRWAPDLLTEEEHEAGAVTKLRYMSCRDLSSSSSTLGFRIEGIKLAKSDKAVKDLQHIQSREEVAAAFSTFLAGRDSPRKQLLTRIRQLRDNFQSSTFFRNHEVIGSSILIIHDDEKAGAWMIDFAKTTQLPDDVNISHRDNWQLGNHEDGYLTGIDSLIKILEEIPRSKHKLLSFFKS